MRKIFKASVLVIGLSAVLQRYAFCAEDVDAAKKDILGQWIEYLEKKLTLTHQFYYEITHNINIYLVIFFLMLILGIIGIWWYGYVQARKMVKRDLEETKAELHGLIMQNLEEHEKSRDARLDTIEGKLYESLAIAYNSEENYNLASVWYARTYREYHNKSAEIISDEHKGRILEWLSKSLEKAKNLSRFGVNEINIAVKLIDDRKFGAQKEKIIAQLRQLG